MRIIQFISIFVIVLCCLLKVFGLSGVVFLVFSIIVCLFSFLLQILSTTCEKTLKAEIYAEKSNPLDDNYSRRVLGLKFSKKFKPVSRKRKEIKKKSIKKLTSKHNFKHKLEHFVEHIPFIHVKHYSEHSSPTLKYAETPQLTSTNLHRTDSKKIKALRSISGTTEIDDVIHKILDYVVRDFLDSWYTVITENKEFTNETRLLIEDSLSNIIKRLKQAPLLNVITTKILDDISAHARAYHDAMRVVKESQKNPKNLTNKVSSLHRRNKSESDVMWNIGGANLHRKVANSTFYSIQTDENLLDPDKQLIEIFFDITSNKFKKESHGDQDLQKYLTSVLETVLYYTMEPESFNCDALRALVTSILGNLLTKVVSQVLSDSDFINFQIAHKFMNNPPPSEWLIKIIRQSNDLSELRAVRQLITKEMDMKHRDKNYAGEVSSLMFAQKEIDIRITDIQKNRDKKFLDREKTNAKIPRLTLDDILSNYIALRYYLDYLQIMNLQKYVIFYFLAQEWRQVAIDRYELAANDESQKDIISRDLRNSAFELFKEYLLPASSNFLNIDQGLIEVLHIKIKDTFLHPDPSWFESICKFVYEKLKNEHVFLQNFYESPAYKKLIAELEVTESEGSDGKLSSQTESGSDSNSGDYLLDELDLLEDDGPETLSVNNTRHQRSHSDTGVLLSKNLTHEGALITTGRKITAKIINTAINSVGNFAVYAINVVVIEVDSDDVKHQKSWHIYRRYSKFLELKKLLVRQFLYFRTVSLPFPKKQTFHNTNRNLLERRMVTLNEFLDVVCSRAEVDDSVLSIIREFLEPDNDDRQIHGTKVIKQIVNPIKSGMKTIKNVPDNVFRIFTGKNVNKLAMADVIDAQSSKEYPALISFVNLLDGVFDLEARSQWIKRGIQGIMLAPFVSQSANKKIKEIVQKNILDTEVIHGVLCGILNNIWPNGTLQDPLPREDNTKLRTRIAAKIGLFSFLTDDLKHILGSETTRIGLASLFEMLQHPILNRRLILILLERLLITTFPTDNMTKHIVKAK